MSDNGDVPRNLEQYSAASIRAYASDLVLFEEFCAGRGKTSIPATENMIAAFIEQQAAAGYRKSTLSRRIAAIRYAHMQVGAPYPAGSMIIAAAIRSSGRQSNIPPAQRAPATADYISLMLKQCEETVSGKRDRALLALGFAGALRRSELVALQLSDIERSDDAIMITIRKSKTDQLGIGHRIEVPNGLRLGVGAALDDWLLCSGITSGPIFRKVSVAGRIGGRALNPDAVRRIVKARIEAIGLDPSDFSGHSLRAGFLTSAVEHGASIFQMMAVSRHATFEGVRCYVRSPRTLGGRAGDGFL